MTIGFIARVLYYTASFAVHESSTYSATDTAEVK